MESVQLPTYLFLPWSYVSVPWPSKEVGGADGGPMTKEPLKSEIRHRPPQKTRAVSTPLDTAGGAPGTMKDSPFASQVPAPSLKSACSGPGLGSGGICGAPA